MSYTNIEHYFERTKVPKREWSGFCTFCEKMGKDPFEVCRGRVQSYFRSGNTSVFVSSGVHCIIRERQNPEIEVNEEDATKLSPNYWRLLQAKVMLLLVSSASILAANLVLSYIVTSDSAVSGLTIALQVIAISSCAISLFFLFMVAPEPNHTGANRSAALKISRGVESGMFLTLLLLFASVVVNGLWATINYL